MRRADGNECGGINMERFTKVCNLICLVGWTLLCLGAATGAMEVDAIDYCLATGMLALGHMADLVV